jgi:hypothetical protein
VWDEENVAKSVKVPAAFLLETFGVPYNDADVLITILDTPSGLRKSTFWQFKTDPVSVSKNTQ